MKNELLKYISDLCDKAEAFDAQQPRGAVNTTCPDDGCMRNQQTKPNVQTQIAEAMGRASSIHEAISRMTGKLEPITLQLPKEAGENSSLGVARELQVPCEMGHSLDRLLAVLTNAEVRIAQLTQQIQLP